MNTNTANTTAEIMNLVRVYVHPGDEITANALIQALKKSFPGMEFEVEQGKDEEYSYSSTSANKAVVGIPASCRFTPANTCRGCGQKITYGTRFSHRENGCAGANQTAAPLAALLADLQDQRTKALQRATLADAAAALCVERGRAQVKYGRAFPPFRERSGVEYTYFDVVPFRDSSKGTLNSGSGISVTWVGTVEEANCLCIVRDGQVVGWVTPAHVWSECYAIGHGHFNSGGVTFVTKGDRAPKGKVLRIKFLMGGDTGIIE